MLLLSDAAGSVYVSGLQPSSQHSRSVQLRSQGEHFSAKLPASTREAHPASAVLRGFHMCSQLSILRKWLQRSGSCLPTPSGTGEQDGGTGVLPTVPCLGPCSCG